MGGRTKRPCPSYKGEGVSLLVVKRAGACSRQSQKCRVQWSLGERGEKNILWKKYANESSEGAPKALGWFCRGKSAPGYWQPV